MKNSIRKIIAGILAAVTLFGIGTTAFKSAKAETDFMFGDVTPRRGTMVVEEPVNEEAKQIEEACKKMSEAMKEADIIKPIKDRLHGSIDTLEVGDPEKEFIKSIADAVLGSTIGTVVSVSGVGAISRCTEAMEEMMAAENCTGAERQAHLNRASWLILEAAITLIPGGSYVLQGKKVLDACGNYFQQRKDDIGEAIVDGVREVAGDDVAEFVNEFGGKIVDGAEYTIDGVKYVFHVTMDGISYTVNGVTYVCSKVADGVEYVGGKIAEGAQYAAETVVEGAEYVGGKIVEGAGYVGEFFEDIGDSILSIFG